MHVDYIAQPDTQLGVLLSELLDAHPPALRATFVSAFVSLQSVMRVKRHVIALRDQGSELRFVLGIDLGGTSREVLREVLGWGIDVRIVKHRIPRHVFHPKVYVFQWVDRATIIIGSNNLTEGGFFGNYEGAVRITYQVPEEAQEYGAACEKLARFLDPVGPTTYHLTAEFLQELVDRGELPTEAEARERQDAEVTSQRAKYKNAAPIFGTEDFEAPPPLPTEAMERLLAHGRARRKLVPRRGTGRGRKAAAAAPIDEEGGGILVPAAFYMTLPKLQGENIPGEARIPLEAIDLARQFWGWPDEYTKEVSPRSGRDRVYWNWRPHWRVWSVATPSGVTVQEVRMYMYENSSDFRFYVRPLVNAGGDLGDVVRIRRISEGTAEFECVLARRGTEQYKIWITFCTQPVRNSTRFFGYT